MKSIFNFLFISKCFVSKNIVALMAVLSIFAVSCQKDITSQPNKVKRVEAIPTVSLNEAKDFFTTTRANSFAGSAIRLSPVWTDTYLDTALSGKQYLIVPIISSGFKINRKAADIRLMFYKNAAGVVTSQLFAFSPTAEYRERKRGVLEIEDFCGTLMFYELDGRLKKAPYYENGRIIAYGTESRYASPRSCREVYVEFACEGCGWYINVCVDNIGSGGGSGGGDPTNGGGPGNDGGNNGGNGSTGGGGGGGGGGGTNNDNGCPTCWPAGDDPNPPNSPAIKIVTEGNNTTPCLTATVLWLSALLPDINGMMGRFNIDKNKNLIVEIGNIGSDDGRTDPNPALPRIAGRDVVITISQDIHSQEYMAATLIHEIIHAYMGTYLGHPWDNTAQHNTMTENFVVDNMIAWLRNAYPSLTYDQAKALSWMGFDQTPGFQSVFPSNTQADLQRKLEFFQNINDEFKDGRKGYPCP